MIKIIKYIFILGLLSSCTTPKQKDENEVNKASEKIVNPTNKVKLSSDIKWEKLNPARGDKSPKAGTIWGDRKGKVATGFLAKFSDGFSSPPHIHNVTYRAVVIKGTIHNDDPNAEQMWMKPGSFWTQPKGESHITSAQGEENIAYVEIDNGPYLVKPITEAFDSGERPVNIDAANVVWLNNKTTNWISEQSNAEISFLWDRDDETNLKGVFVKLPSKFEGSLINEGKIFHAIIIKGELSYKMPDESEEIKLDSGSSFSATSKSEHTLSNTNSEEVILYIRTNGSFSVRE